MNCDDVVALFSEYYDGEDFDASAEFSAHLLECLACAEEYKRYAQLMDEVKALPEPAMPVGFHAALMRRVRDTSARKRRGFYLPFVAAAAAAVFIVGFWFAGVFEFGGNYVDFAPEPAAAIMMEAPVATMDIAPAVGTPVPEMFSPMHETRGIEPSLFHVEPRQFGAFAETVDVDDVSVSFEFYGIVPDDAVTWSLDEDALLLDETIPPAEEPRGIFSFNQLLGMISFVGLLVSIRLMLSFRRRQ